MPIRKATLDDMDELVNLVHIWDAEEENPRETDLEKIENYIIDDGIYLYYNEDEEDEPVGIMITSDNYTHVNLFTLYVHPDHRSEGIGSELLTKLTDMLNKRSMGAFLEVEAHSPAVDLYERFGFKEDSRVQVSTNRIAMSRKAPPAEDLSL